MAFMDTSYGDDDEPIMTTVSVHSPAIQNSQNGTFYTSYAISIKSNNSCFTLQQSCVRRRYSEFVHLRDLLKSQHPTIDPPVLPPKNYFSRFNTAFVAERAEGLEIFLRDVVDVPVYLSNKGIHLFLQTHFTMVEIDKLVTGDIPTPQLIGEVHRPSLFEESCSSLPSTGSSTESNNQSLSVSVQLGVSRLPQKHEEHDSAAPSNKQLSSISESKPISISTSPDLCVKKTENLCIGSPVLSDCSEKSLSSTSSSPDSERNGARRVSFNEKVTVAVVKNQLWNYAVKPIKAGAC